MVAVHPRSDRRGPRRRAGTVASTDPAAGTRATERHHRGYLHSCRTGGIGVVRLSGSGSRADQRKSCVIQSACSVARTAAWRQLADDAGDVDRQVVVTYFAAPRSYTAEDVIEISCHGCAGDSAVLPRTRLTSRSATGRTRRVHAPRLSQRPHRSAAGRSGPRSDRSHHVVPGAHRGAASGGIGFAAPRSR